MFIVLFMGLGPECSTSSQAAGDVPEHQPITNVLRFSNPKTDSQDSPTFGRQLFLGRRYPQLRDTHLTALLVWGLGCRKQLLEDAFTVVMFILLLSTKMCLFKQSLVYDSHYSLSVADNVLEFHKCM